MADKIEQIRKYIQRTKPSVYSDRYQMRYGHLIALTDMAKNGRPCDAVMLAAEYGIAMGLRMGRREAVSMK